MNSLLVCDVTSSNGKQTPRECQNHCSLGILFVMSLCNLTWPSDITNRSERHYWMRSWGRERGLMFALPALLLFFEKGFVKEGRGEFYGTNSGYSSERAIAPFVHCIYLHTWFGLAGRMHNVYFKMVSGLATINPKNIHRRSHWWRPNAAHAPPIPLYDATKNI